MELTGKAIVDYITLGNAGSIASIFGFLLTIYVFLTIRAIKRNYLFRARVPVLQKKLQKHASAISTALHRYDESTIKIMEELSLAEVNSFSLQSKTTGKLKSSLKIVVRDIRHYKSTGGNKEELRRIYLSMNMIIQEITNFREDDKWESNDG